MTNTSTPEQTALYYDKWFQSEHTAKAPSKIANLPAVGAEGVNQPPIAIVGVLVHSMMMTGPSFLISGKSIIR
jgi:hypothetical protein